MIESTRLDRDTQWLALQLLKDDRERKKAVLFNPISVEQWAKENTAFQQSKLAQDYDVLALAEGWVANNLAIHSDTWALTPAAQDINVLSLCHGSVVYNLSLHSSWAKTPAAQNAKILSLCEGKSVNRLASQWHSWRSSEAAFRKDVLSLRDDLLFEFCLNNLETTKWEHRTLVSALHRFLAAGAYACISAKACMSGYAEEVQSLRSAFTEEGLNSLDEHVRDSILELDSQGLILHKAVFRARSVLAFHYMKGLFTNLASSLERKGAEYADELQSQLSVMNTSQIEELQVLCVKNGDASELELILKAMHIVSLNTSNIDDAEPCLSAPRMY